MSAAPDLMTRIAMLERERNEARATVARVEALAAKFDRWPSSPSLTVAAKAIRDALDPPAERLCNCRGDAANICPPCRPKAYE